MYICKSLTKKKEDVVLKKFRETDFTKFFVRLISQKKTLYGRVRGCRDLLFFKRTVCNVFFQDAQPLS